MNITVTELEQAALNAIQHDDFLDGLTGDHAVGKFVWADCATDNIVRRSIVTRSQVSGVISSLSKKGLIDYSHDGKDSTFALTQLGASFIEWE